MCCISIFQAKQGCPGLDTQSVTSHSSECYVKSIMTVCYPRTNVTIKIRTKVTQRVLAHSPATICTDVTMKAVLSVGVLLALGLAIVAAEDPQATTENYDAHKHHKTDYVAETPHPADYHHSDYNYVPVPGPPVHVAGPPGPNGGFACPMNTMPMPVDVPSTAPHGTPAHGHHGHRNGGGHSWAPMAHRTAMAMISHCPAGTTVATAGGSCDIECKTESWGAMAMQDTTNRGKSISWTPPSYLTGIHISPMAITCKGVVTGEDWDVKRTKGKSGSSPVPECDVVATIICCVKPATQS